MPRVAVALLAFLAAACANLPEIEPGACGNGVVDPEEDCDTRVDPALGAAARCGSPSLGARACRLICETHAGCPPRWGCGAAGICLAPHGAEPDGWRVAAGSPWSLPAAALAVGDVDGDAIPDVLGFSLARFGARYGSGDGRFPVEASFGTELALQLPAFARIDGDARLDALVALPAGVTTVRGAGDRALAAFAHPARRGPAAAQDGDVYLPLRTGRGSGHALLHFRGDGITVFDDVVLGDVGEPVLLPEGHLATELAGTIPVADLDGDGDEELVLAFQGDEVVRVYALEIQDGVPRPIERAVLLLPAGFVVLEGAQLADVDGDGATDVLVGMRPHLGLLEGVVGVARAIAPGNFVDVERALLHTEIVSAGCGTSEWPLASGDVSGDGVADYVGAHGVCVNVEGGLVRAGVNPSPSPWTAALLADFNKDGQRDVAAVAQGLLNVDLVLADPAGRGFNYTRALTGGPPSHLAAGDFNGDFVEDLAVAETGGAGSVVSVIFGVAGGLPEAAVAVGRFTIVAGLRAAELGGAAGVPDLTSDLVVDEIIGGERALTFLRGNAQRAMSSPFPLRVEAGVFDLPQAVAAADLDGDGHTDAAVLARDGTLEDRNEQRVWRLGGDGTGRWSETARSPVLAGDQPFDALCALYRAATVADGREVVVIATGRRGCSGAPEPPRIGVLAWAQEMELVMAPVEAGLSSPSALEVADLDGNGDVEILVSFAGGDTIAVYDLADARAPLAEIALPAEPLGVTAVQADGDAAMELGVLTAAGVFVADVSDAGAWSVSGPVVEGGAGADGGSRIVALDLDGDGLEDLVYNSTGQVHVALAVGRTLAEAR